MTLNPVEESGGNCRRADKSLEIVDHGSDYPGTTVDNVGCYG